MTRSSLSILAAAATLTVATIGPAASQSGQSITLRVPVELKEMVALGARVSCGIYTQGHDYSIGTEIAEFAIPGGEFNEVLEIVVDPSPGLSFAGATSYRCILRVSTEAPPTDPQNPYIGTPAAGYSSAYLLARPDEFFQQVITGPISIVAIPAAPGGLQLAPNN